MNIRTRHNTIFIIKSVAVLSILIYIFVPPKQIQENKKINSYKLLIRNMGRFKSVSIKTILFWTPFWGAHSLHGWNISETTLDGCSVKCHLTVDRRYLLESDALVFEINSIYDTGKHSYPSIRRPNQMWVFFRNEPPGFFDVDLRAYSNIFNWTMTYRLDSDIPCPYGSFDNIEKNESMAIADPLKQEFNKTMPAKKAKLVAWAVSHCKTDSLREELVEELQKYVPVDIFGACGTLQCGERVHMWKSDGSCHREIAEKYKFYLSLEHKLCEDYVTEKFFTPLTFHIVPIVYGRSSYTNFAPNKSYINVQDFSTIKELGEYLLYLDKNDDEYQKYFDWKRSLVVNQDLSMRWCHLCVKISNRSRGDYQVYNDIHKWWNYDKWNKSICSTPTNRWK